MRLRSTMFLMAILILACTGSSSDDDTGELSDSGPGSAGASCEADPDGVSVQYRCDSTETSGQCVDYLEGFDVANMDVACDALGGTATLDEACDVESALGRCCSLMNGQWSVTHYADTADAPLSASELQGFCESAGGSWFP